MNEEFSNRLKELGVSEDAIAILEEQELVTAEALEGFTYERFVAMGIKAGSAKALTNEFNPASSPGPALSAITSMNNVLPDVPADDSWLAALKVGGILKFSKETVVGTVSAALASRVGLYDLPKLIVERMEQYAESLEEPVPPEFFQMQRILTQRNYADLFAAIPGVSGQYATKERRVELLKRLEVNLWPSLTEFQSMLNSWFDSWQKAYANPAMMMNTLATIVGGGGIAPSGMMQPPPIDPLRDAAENVITSINRVFAGTGIPVAMALAFDAQQIRKALEDPSLPAQIGAANREQMLRQLGVAVTSDYPRLEQSLKQYVLGVVELPNVTTGQTELAYVTALYQLGNTISWERLGAQTIAASSGRLELNSPVYVRGDHPNDRVMR